MTSTVNFFLYLHVMRLIYLVVKMGKSDFIDISDCILLSGLVPFDFDDVVEWELSDGGLVPILENEYKY